MSVENKTMMSRAEMAMINNGIEFKLPVDAISQDLYDELLSVMLEYVGKYTDKPVKYIGDWHITIRAYDLDFSIDSNGYYMGENLTPEQEQHNLALDTQV